MIVMKFGGSSVGNADRIKNVSDIIKKNLEKKPIVVVSAVRGITDRLIELANKSSEGKDVSKELEEIKKIHYDIINQLGLDSKLVDKELKELSELVDKIFVLKRVTLELMDEIQSFGERISCRILAAYLRKIGINAKAFDAYDLGMITTPDYGCAEPLPDTEEKIDRAIKKLDVIPVITGFIGKDSAGNITTFGRGGSDYTAGIIGAAVKAKEIQIWTDVEGVLTADPKVVSGARTIDKISFDEASELAYFGARVLHPKTILPAINKNIPVRVLSSFSPEHPGTLIVSELNKIDGVVKAIACKKNIYLVNIVSTRMLLAHGFLARIFNIFEDYKKSVDMVSTSEVSVSLTLDNDSHLDDILEDLRSIADVRVSKDKAIVCVVGAGMKNTPGIAGRVFSTLGKNNISVEMISQGASEINIGFIVDGKDADNAVRLLHKEFIS